MRLQLLEIQDEFHTDLVKSLYGLLMLLPQSAAFRVLRDRLASVTSMATTIGRVDFQLDKPRDCIKTEDNRENENQARNPPRINAEALLHHFDRVQATHTKLRTKGAFDKDIRKT